MIRGGLFGLCLSAVLFCWDQNEARAQNFLRGDVNCNGAVNFIDAVHLSRALSTGVALPCNCDTANDANFDNAVDLADVIYLLNYATSGGAAPPAPFPACGPPPAGTTLGCVSYPGCPMFKRGDADGDGCVSPADATFLLDWVFASGPAPACMLSADADDDDDVDVSDSVAIMNYCSLGSVIPAPGPLVCGPDPTPGVLTCGSYTGCGTGCTNQIPMDCNQDGVLNISDAVCVLNVLFGTPPPLPCGDGTGADPRNVLLLDANGDFGLDLSDAVYLLTHLFLSGPAPFYGLNCTYFEGCPQNPSCPDCVP